ncbi:hypothetical protein GTV32_20510 [Gordonia sp. SID5947]|uniref:hypothetical protein n=1 Tax=Gordonia sp. SID5947 TaxID=2690315 RepID=UPI00136E0C42|nr:hypothetical protein [Gordonia sp. SID5947]MYR08541.1 hypothetical protein [Gordonia sp. SID5947]
MITRIRRVVVGVALGAAISMPLAPVASAVTSDAPVPASHDAATIYVPDLPVPLLPVPLLPVPLVPIFPLPDVPKTVCITVVCFPV